MDLPAPVFVPPPPVRVETPKPPPAASAATNGAAYTAVDQCKERVFLSRELCLAEHCDKPGARNHPLCIKRREDIRMREEGKVRQGPQ